MHHARQGCFHHAKCITPSRAAPNKYTRQVRNKVLDTMTLGLWDCHLPVNITLNLLDFIYHVNQLSNTLCFHFMHQTCAVIFNRSLR
jgi:hypothetical protein